MIAATNEDDGMSITEQIAEAVSQRMKERYRARETLLASSLARMPMHERVRLVIEQGAGEERLRVRAWSEMTFTEFTRLTQAMVRLADYPGHLGPPPAS